MILLVLYGILYIFSTLIPTFVDKINQIYFNSDNYFLILVVINIFFPINIIIFLFKYRFKDLKNLFTCKKYMFLFSIPAIVYTIETTILFWVIINIPYNIYIIGRTSSSFFNVPFSLWYLNKKINPIYYIGLIILSISYILIFIHHNKSETDIDTIKILPAILVILSGLSTATYGNIIEKQLTNVDKEEKLKLMFFYQIIANMYGFIFIMPISLYITIKNKYYSFEYIPNILYVFIGILYQIYFLFKILILGYNNINSNQILSGLDIFRRTLSNLLAYTILNEYYNLFIILSNVCMFISSIFFSISNIKFKNQNKIEYIKLQEI
jgi:hypothetical protein